MGKHHIIVGVDGSEHSLQAVRWAIEEAQLRDADLTALFAWQYPLIGIPGAFDRDELEREAQRFLAAEIAAVQPPDGVKIRQLVAQGDPSASLMHACEEFGADLLVLGSRGREGFVGLLLGSVGQECAVHAPCPVLICKDNNHRESPAEAT